MTFALLDVVALKRALPEHHLPEGAQGTIVELFTPDAFMVEFADTAGKTLALPVLTSEDVRPLTRSHEFAAE